MRTPDGAFYGWPDATRVPGATRSASVFRRSPIGLLERGPAFLSLDPYEAGRWGGRGGGFGRCVRGFGGIRRSPGPSRGGWRAGRRRLRAASAWPSCRAKWRAWANGAGIGPRRAIWGAFRGCGGLGRWTSGGPRRSWPGGRGPGSARPSGERFPSGSHPERMSRSGFARPGQSCVGWRCGKWRTGHLPPS